MKPDWRSKKFLLSSFQLLVVEWTSSEVNTQKMVPRIIKGGLGGWNAFKKSYKGATEIEIWK